MAKKLVAVFVTCMVVLAAVHVHKAEADYDDYRKCYDTCHKDCSDDGHGNTFCEMKCDTECGAKEIKAKLEKIYP